MMLRHQTLSIVVDTVWIMETLRLWEQHISANSMKTLVMSCNVVHSHSPHYVGLSQENRSHSLLRARVGMVLLISVLSESQLLDQLVLGQNYLYPQNVVLRWHGPLPYNLGAQHRDIGTQTQEHTAQVNHLTPTIWTRSSCKCLINTRLHYNRFVSLLSLHHPDNLNGQRCNAHFTTCK